jgi:hypothetical protein
MSMAGITKRIAETSPRLKARIAGILYLLIFIVAPSGAATLDLTDLAQLPDGLNIVRQPAYT